ncbi:hypothetical protein GF314_13600, partial [bacterium]|nr:hypothetical protein [bacterium]
MIALLLRLAGVPAHRVLGLARALRADAHGKQELQYEERGRRGLHPDTGRRVMLAMLLVMSVLLAVVAVVLRERLLLVAVILMAAQVMAAFLRAATEVVPLVLGGDDRPVLGWWPVTGRELLVARGLLVGGSVVEASVAILAAPLVAVAVAARPPVLPAVGLLVGAALQAVALASVMVLLAQAAGRMLGVRRARRLAEVTGTLLLIVAINVGIRAARTWLGDLAALSPWWLLVAPPAWFAAWGAWTEPTGAVLVGAAASLAVTAGLVAAGTRALGGLGIERVEDPAARRPRRDWTAPLVALTWPGLRGRDGRALRLLLRAHLREDWRLTGSLLFLPVAMLVYLVV